ncbi:hypothetical protein FQN49_008399, partial [Arthroderma sp. PD_2]
CGLQRPACAQCVRSKRECVGYPGENIFVFVKPGSKKKRGEPENCEEVERRKPPTVSLDDEDSTSTEQSTDTDWRLTTTTYENQLPYPFTENSNASRIVIRSSNCHNLVNTFIVDCFPLDRPHATFTTDGRPWTYFLPQLPTKSRALESASVAVAAAALGRKHGIRDLSREGLKYYTRALRHLQEALWDKDLVLEDETLTACMAVGMFEVIECANLGRSAFESHVKGLMALVRARGTKRHTSGPGYALFLAMRCAGIMMAIRNKTPNFLSEPVWMEGPWALNPKSLMDRVHDCLALTPAIAQKTSLIPYLEPQKKVDLARRVALNYWEIERMLDDVYAEIQSTGPSPLYWPVTSTLQLPPDPKREFFPVAYWFSDLMTAWMMMTFWATRVMIWTGLGDIYKIIEEIQPDLIDNFPSPDSSDNATSVNSPYPTTASSALPQLDHRKDYLSLAHNVCRSAEYCVQEKTRMAGSVTVIPPLGLLMGSLAHRREYAREIVWIRALISLIRLGEIQSVVHGSRRKPPTE